MIVRALLDPASTASFITERAAQHLKLRREKQEISVSGIGGTQCLTQSHAVVNVNLKSVQNSMSLHSVQAIVLSSLTKHLPITSLPKGDWPHLSSLKLADPEFNVSKPIDALLGVDVYQNILKPGLIHGPKGTPAAQNTIFGIQTLGMEYSSSQDYFRFSPPNSFEEESHITKRAVLSDSAKIFDPLGFISCVTIVVKIIFQKLWERGTTWDEPLPPDIQRDWLDWRMQLSEISALHSTMLCSSQYSNC